MPINPKSITAAVVFLGLLGSAGVGALVSMSKSNVQAELVNGTQATGTTICYANPVDNDLSKIGGQTLPVVVSQANDAAAPVVNCLDGGCSSASGMAQALSAAVNAQAANRVYCGHDGGVVNCTARDAGCAGNRPISWYVQTRVTDTDVNSSTAAGTSTLTASSTLAGTATKQLTGTGSATSTAATWTTSVTDTGTVSQTGSITSTGTVTAIVTTTDSVLGTRTLTASVTATGSNTWTAATTNTVSGIVTGSGTAVTTRSATSTVSATGSGTTTLTASGTVSGTTTSTFTGTSTATGTGTSTGMSGGQDPATIGGPNVCTIGNSFDPAASGLIAPVGTIARTADGTKAWTKTGTANTSWVSEDKFTVHD